MPATARRAIFIDVDGTLVDYRGRVPTGARDAIARARANGHLAFLCTGRSISAIWKELYNVGWDGIVGAAGGYVEVGGDVIVHRNVPAAQVERIVDLLGGGGVEFLLESNSGIYASRGASRLVREQMLWGVTDPDLRAELLRSVASFLDRLDSETHLIREDINKVVFLGTGLSLDEISAALGDDFDVVPASVAGFGGEISIKGVHKAAGIEAVLDHLGMEPGDAVAFGDGYNDLEMLAYVGVGVAMGNAPDEVRGVADRVTGTPEEDGIRAGMVDLGLI